MKNEMGKEFELKSLSGSNSIEEALMFGQRRDSVECAENADGIAARRLALMAG